MFQLQFTKYFSIMLDGSLGYIICFDFSITDFEDAIIQGCPQLEILNSRFTRNYGDWALGFCGDIYVKENSGADCSGDGSFEGITSLDLSGRGIHNLIQKVRSIIFLGMFVSK